MNHFLRLLAILIFFVALPASAAEKSDFTMFSPPEGEFSLLLPGPLKTFQPKNATVGDEAKRLGGHFWESPDCVLVVTPNDAPSWKLERFVSELKKASWNGLDVTEQKSVSGPGWTGEVLVAKNDGKTVDRTFFIVMEDTKSEILNVCYKQALTPQVEQSIASFKLDQAKLKAKFAAIETAKDERYRPKNGTETAGLYAIGAGLLIMFAGYVYLLVIAFKQSIGWGVVVVLIPFAGFVFLVRHFQKAWRPFAMYIVGVVSLVVGGIYAPH